MMAAWCFDLAMSEDEVADYSVWSRVILTRSRRLVFTRIEQRQERWPLIVAALRGLVRAWPEDDFVFPRHVLENLALKELVAAFPSQVGRFKTVSYPAKSDKRSRARVLEGACAAGRVWTERGPIGDLMVDELVGFPAEHDDFVDMATLAAWHYGLQHELRVDFVEHRNPAGSSFEGRLREVMGR